MNTNPFFLIYGILLLGFASMAEYRGWTFSGVNQPRTIPRTVRDNPGANHSPYVANPRYSGGK